MEYDTTRLPDGRIRSPSPSPDCPYKAVSPGSTIPETAVEFGKLFGDPVYVGRVYDDECWYVGTAVPNKGLCYYLNEIFELKSSDSYDILTVDGGEPLEFRKGAIDSDLLLVAAGNQDRCLYAARIVDGENTYIGWVDQSIKIANIPRDPSKGPNQINGAYDVLIHKYIHELCICPTPPPYSYH